MTDVRSDRLSAGAGVLAAALFAAGFVLIGVDATTSDATRSEVVATYADDATNSRQALGVLLTGLGGICFLRSSATSAGCCATVPGRTASCPQRRSREGSCSSAACSRERC